MCAWGTITSSVWTCCVQDVMEVETFLVDSWKYRAEAQGLGAADSNSRGWGSEDPLAVCLIVHAFTKLILHLHLDFSNNLDYQDGHLMNECC